MLTTTKNNLLTSTALVACLTTVALSPNITMANPKGGKVVAGEATITKPNDSTVQINQSSQNAVINWQSFDIAPNETTRFVQPNYNSWTLNRITGDIGPSAILGTIQANGNVAIVNPDGIVFGSGSRVDMNSLIATTNDIENNDFLAGRMHFNIPGNPAASIIKEGNISINDHGLAAFVAPGVRNSGVITARFGSVSLAAGNKFTLDLYGDGLINLVTDDEIAEKVIDVATGKPITDLVKNEGKISANGGLVALSSATARRAVNSVINNTGIIETNTIGVHKGKITLGAQTAGTKTLKSLSAPRLQRVIVSGTLNAYALPSRVPLPKKRPSFGGNIEITGKKIKLVDAALNVYGTNGGGTVLVGGDYMGGKSDPTIVVRHNIQLEENVIPTSTFVSANSGTIINADATGDGNGGKVILWSDHTTHTAASIFARGGRLGGDGGFVETSGKRNLSITRAVDASASNGNSGTWLLDPENLTITDSISGTTDTTIAPRANAGDPHILTANGENSLVETSVIETGLNNGTDVSLIASDNINVQSDILKSTGGNATLTLNAGKKLTILASNIESTGNQLQVRLTAGEIKIDSSNSSTPSTINTNGGNFYANSNGPASRVNIARTTINTGGGDAFFDMQGIAHAQTSGFLANGIGLFDTNLNTQGGNIQFQSIDGTISTQFDTTINTGGGDLKMITVADQFTNTMNIYADAAVTSNGGNVEIFSSDLISMAQANIQTAGGKFSADATTSNTGQLLINGADIQTGGGNIKLLSSSNINFSAINAGNGFETPNINAGSGKITLTTNEIVNFTYRSLLTANHIAATAHKLNAANLPFPGEAAISGGYYTLNSATDIVLNGSEFDLAVKGGNEGTLNLNFEGGHVGQNVISRTKSAGFDTFEINRGNIDAGLIDFKIDEENGDFIYGTFKSDGLHFNAAPSIKTAKTVQIDLGNMNDTNNGVFFDATQSGILETYDNSNGNSLISLGKIEFIDVNNVNGETADANSLSVAGTKNVYLNTIKYTEQTSPQSPQNSPPSIGTAFIDIDVTNSGAWPGFRSPNTAFYDADGLDTLTLSVANLPTGLIFTDNSDGTFNVALDAGFADPLEKGTHTITVTARDSEDASISTIVNFVIAATQPTTPGIVIGISTGIENGTAGQSVDSPETSLKDEPGAQIPNEDHSVSRGSSVDFSINTGEKYANREIKEHRLNIKKISFNIAKDIVLNGDADILLDAFNGDKKFAGLLIENIDYLFKNSTAFLLSNYGFDIAAIVESKFGRKLNDLVYDELLKRALEPKNIEIFNSNFSNKSSLIIDIAFSVTEGFLVPVLEDIGMDKAGIGLVKLGFGNSKAAVKAAKGDVLGAGIDFVWAEVSGAVNFVKAAPDVADSLGDLLGLITGDTRLIPETDILVNVDDLKTTFSHSSAVDRQKMIDYMNYRYREYPVFKQELFAELQSI